MEFYCDTDGVAMEFTVGVDQRDRAERYRGLSDAERNGMDTLGVQDGSAGGIR
jgi:hypothetical protein